MSEKRIIYQLCYQTATQCNELRHAVRIMQELSELQGFKIIKTKPVSIADSWMFEVDKVIESPPKYLIRNGRFLI